MPMRGELPTPSARLDAGPATAASWWSRMRTETGSRDLLAVVYFSVIGLLIAVCVIRAFPDLRGLIEAYAQFP